jgi:CRISPR-associated endonuclease Csn1
MEVVVQQMGNIVLGLDLGPNSIGWALVEDFGEESERSRIVDLGVRVFPEGVDKFDSSKEVSRNESRRVARGMRRQTARRVRRRKYLRNGLVEAGLLPADLKLMTEIYALDPYSLRAKAVQEKLEPYELGRVFLHMGQRRGFLSNRKKDRNDSDLKGLLAEIQENEAERIKGDYLSLGHWLNSKNQNRDHRSPTGNDHVRRRHLSRKEYLEEFELIWAHQASYDNSLLTQRLKTGRNPAQSYPALPAQKNHKHSMLEEFGIQGLLYFQRPMYWPRSVVGLCELEPKKKRCPHSDRRYQKFRILQEVNNLRYISPDTGEEQPLEAWQRESLVSKLGQTKEMTFDQIRKHLSFLNSVQFNLQRGSRSKLKGATIDALFANKNVLGKSWYERGDDERTAIVEMLLEVDDDEAFIRKATADWGMTLHEADAAVCVDLPPGYGSLSRTALDKLIPFLEKGMKYMGDNEGDSAMHAAGYFRRDQLRRRIFDRLPDPQRESDSPIGDIPNPVVKRALTEVRRVVNAIIREYGKPDAVHVEMAREVTQGKERRNEYSKRIREREKVRSDVADILKKEGIRPTRDSILKYRLWQEQELVCIYSGRPISFRQLFDETGGVDVDHVLPRSRTLDDSQMNKVVCIRKENADKGDLTPYEWLGNSNAEKFDSVCQRAGALMRAGKMPYNKYRRFVQKELNLDQFISRQLNDTGYITKATAEYLRCLFDQPHDVVGLKGQLTAELRWHWGLETILSELPDSPAWHEASKLRDGQKNRADHRHHAIDAVVIALTNRSRLQKLSKIVKKGGAKKHGEILFDPWSKFRDEVKEKIAAVNVSHRVERKVRGALHEETLYGPTKKDGEWVVRKKLVDLSASEVEMIRDDTIRDIVLNRLKNAGIKVGRGKKPNKKKMQEALIGVNMPSGVPVKKVRILKNEKTVRKLRPDNLEDQTFVKPGSTHHFCLFEWEEKGKIKRDAVFVTMLEAAQRLKDRETVIRRHHPDNPNARFVMSLASRELVLATIKGKERLLTLKTSSSTSGLMRFAEHTDSRKTNDFRKYHFSPSTFSGRKVTVDPLGRIRWAND